MHRVTTWMSCSAMIGCLWFAPGAAPQGALPTLNPDAELDSDVVWCNVPHCVGFFLAFDGQTALVPFSESGLSNDDVRIGVNTRDASGNWPLTAMVANPDHALDTPRTFTPMPLNGPAAVQGDTMLVVGTSRIWRHRDVIYVMKRVAGQWMKQQVLAPQFGPEFGDARITDVELDGGTALVSVINEREEPDGSFVSHAQVNVYMRQADGRLSWRAIIDPGSWTRLDPETGYRVAIDGDLALIGDPTALSGTGRAFLYERTSRGWMRRKTLEPIAAATNGIRFGDSVDIDGGTAVVAAPYQQSDSGLGAVYVYGRSGTVWQQSQVLPGTRPVSVNSVAVAGDRLVIASDGFMVADAPLAWLFERRASTWTVVGRLGGTVEGDVWELSERVSLEGSTVLLGAFRLMVTLPSTNLVYELPPVGTL